MVAMMASSCIKDEVITDDSGDPTSPYRPKSKFSQAASNCVFEYTPAPGQFINEDKSGFSGESTPAEAAAYAQKRLNAEKYVSLGGFGGYIVVGFDGNAMGRFNRLMPVQGSRLFSGVIKAFKIDLFASTFGYEKKGDKK